MVRSSPSARPSRKSLTTRIVWRHATCRVRHTRDYLSAGWDHIEIDVLSPEGAPLPITETGYLSHFLSADEVAGAGGAVSYFTAWLDREARSKAWAETEFAWRQGDLFGSV